MLLWLLLVNRWSYLINLVLVVMPINPMLLAAVPGLVSGIANMAGSIFRNRSARREARAMNRYNSPKAQMARFREAGLSPYLIYGQGTPGNMSSPIPARESGIESLADEVSDSPGRYMNFRQGDQSFQSGKIQQSILREQLTQEYMRTEMQRDQADMLYTDRQRKAAEFFIDFPEYVDRMDQTVDRHMVDSSFKQKMNELKRAAAQTSLDRMRLMVQNQGFRNAVDRVKAAYATDYGMVGGDWTQGLGLLRSIPSMFRRAKGAVSMPAKRVMPGKGIAPKKFTGGEFNPAIHGPGYRSPSGKWIEY